MTEAFIENGAARVAAGEWLMGAAQPVASRARADVRLLRGFIVPDRSAVRRVASAGEMWCAAAEGPFLTRLTALPDEPLQLVSAKLLVAPFESRVGAKALKLVPLSFARATAVTAFKGGWVVAATRSRVSKVDVAEGETLQVRPEALVAWIGKDPTGFCPKLGVWDLLLPRGPKNLAYSFHGPAVVWFEGAQALVRKPPFR